MGLSAKVFDNAPFIGALGTDLGIWILVAACLAVYSYSPQSAALHVFLFFLSMLGAYYLVSTWLFGFFPVSYFAIWGGLGVLASLGAGMIWYARGDGWFAAFCAALPVAVLVCLGDSFFYTFSPVHGFDLLAAVVLFVLVPISNRQRLRIIPFAIVLFLLIDQLNLISFFFGGL